MSNMIEPPHPGEGSNGAVNTGAVPELSVSGAKLTGVSRSPPEKPTVKLPKKASKRPDITKQNSPHEKPDAGKSKTNQQRRDNLEKKIRKRVALEEKAFRIVEELLDTVTGDVLIKVANYIDPNHYADIVEERAISSLCGYPICDNNLSKTPKQKYHISTKSNTVFDISERKKFCNNACFRASNFYAKQLSSTPVWLRDTEEPLNITLLCDEDNSGSRGTDVLSKNTIETKTQKNQESVTEKPDQTDKSEKIDTAVLDEIAVQMAQVCIDMAEREEAEESCTESDLLLEDMEIVTDSNEGGLNSPHPGSDHSSARSSSVETTPRVNSSRGSSSNADDERSTTGENPSAGHLVEPSEIDTSHGVTLNTGQSGVVKQSSETESNGLSVGRNLSGASPKELVQDTVISSVNMDTPSPSDIKHIEGEQTVKSAIDTTCKRGTLLRDIPVIKPKLSPIDKAIKRIENKRAALEGKKFVLSPVDSRLDETMDDSKSKKAQMLMDFIQKKENLMDEIKKKSTTEIRTIKPSEKSEAETLEKIREKHKKSARTVQLTDALPMPSARNKPEYTGPVPSKNKTPRKKITKSDVMANIKRASAQKNKQQFVGHPSDQSGELDVKSKQVKSKGKRSTLEVVQDRLLDWKTTASVQFVKTIGKKGKSSGSFEEKYQQLSRKVDQRIALDGDLLDDEEVNTKRVKGKLPDISSLEKEDKDYADKVQQFYDGEKSGRESHAGDIVLPTIDSQSQLSIQRKIVLDKLSKVLPDLLAPLRLVLRDVSTDLRQMISTFNLHSKNITLKPAEWSLLAYVLLRLLAIRNQKVYAGLKNEYASHYFNTMILSMGVTKSQITTLVTKMAMSDEEGLD